MKKKFLVILTGIFATSVALTLLSHRSDSLNQFLKANIEALAQDEDGGGVKNAKSDKVDEGRIESKNGKVKIGDMEIKVRRGTSVKWERYECKYQSGSTCYMQGIYIKLL